MFRSFFSCNNNSDINKFEKNNKPEKDKSKQINKNKPKIDKNWKEILGRTGQNKHAHVLAIEQLTSDKPVTAKVINDILAFANITITEDQLNSLVNTPSFVFDNLDKTKTKQDIKLNIGLPNSKKTKPGIYIFTHLPSGRKYVGSSSELGKRIDGYLKGTHRNQGLLIPLLKKEKNKNFILEVFPMTDNYIKKSEIILEQYYLVNPFFTLNTIKVANNPSGSTAKSLYMYNRDLSVLYYYSFQQKDFINNLNIHYVTFTKHLEKGTYYLGKYVFLREPVLTAKVKDVSDLELFEMLKKDRVAFNKNKPLKNNLAKAVLLIDSKNSNNIMKFENLAKCIEFYRTNGLSATQTTLVKRLNKNIIYHGYFCKTV